MKDIKVISCPKCGAQMLMSEVYMPESFFGKQTEIIKTPSGEIDFYMGDDQDFDEEYTCDYCNSKLKIHTNVSFDVSIDTTEDEFEGEYSTKRNKKIEEVSIF